MFPKPLLVLLLSYLTLAFSSPVAWSQLSVPRLEQAAKTPDENPTDTVEVFNGTLGLNLSQTALANWAGGGESSVAFTALCQLGNKVERGTTSALEDAERRFCTERHKETLSE